MFTYKIKLLKLKLQSSYMLKMYKLRHFLFSWKQDEEGDIVFSVASILHFIKYKEHTIVKFGKMGYEAAPKYVRGE